LPFHSYILQSITTGRKYYGSCENIGKRISQHNRGRVKSTKAYIPYKLLHSEEYPTKSEAFARERYFKTLEGYIYLKENKII
jgi:putative endonuclease